MEKCPVCNGNSETCWRCDGSGAVASSLFAENATSKYGFNDSDSPVSPLVEKVRLFLNEKLGREIEYFGGGLHNSALDVSPEDIENHLPYPILRKADQITEMFYALLEFSHAFDPWEDRSQVLNIVVPAEQYGMAPAFGEGYLAININKADIPEVNLWKKLMTDHALPGVSAVVIEYARVGFIDPDEHLYNKNIERLDIPPDQGYIIANYNGHIEPGGVLLVSDMGIFARFENYESQDLTEIFAALSN